MSLRHVSFAEGEYYHIYSRGTEKRPLFLEEKDYTRFETLLYSANSDTSVHLSNYQGKALLEIPKGNPLVAIGVWCLMSNHFHLLLKEITPNGISTFLQKLLTGHSMYFNKKYDRKGSLFEGKFKAKHLNTNEYLKYQYAYIHLNPIGIIDAGWKQKSISNKKFAQQFIKTYAHSSYSDYVGSQRPEAIILDRTAFPQYFASAADFESMLNEWLNFD